MCVTPHAYIWQEFILGGHCVSDVMYMKPHTYINVGKSSFWVDIECQTSCM